MTKMTYNLFLDDERFPPNDGGNWVICRTVQEAKAFYLLNGAPTYVSFDHDLGENNQTGLDYAKWLVDKDLTCDGKFLNNNFEYYVHSQNPVGAENIRKYLSQYLNQKNRRTML